MINARFGTGITLEDLKNLGKTILKRERAFNLAAGGTTADDRLPDFFKEPLPPHNAVWDFTGEELDRVMGFFVIDSISRGNLAKAYRCRNIF